MSLTNPTRLQHRAGRTFSAAASIVESLEQRCLLSTASLSAGAVQAVSRAATKAEASQPNLGINIRRLGFDSGDELFADAMKEPNTWSTDLANPADTSAAAPIDANGWPTTDAGVEIINNASDDGGTYALSFTGQASVAPAASDPGVQVINLSYNADLNTTTAQVIVPAGGNQLTLDFTNTRRLATDSAATGITNIQLMRPSYPDSSVSYGPSTIFSTPILNLISNFSTIRYMDYSLTNFNPQVNWSDRTLPSQIQTNGKGGAWEYAVALANQTGKDMWINVPEMATDQYITNLADLINYGSDGVNAYTGPEGSAVSPANSNPVPSTGPVWAGINPNLHVYVEYSNEVWNNSFAQNEQNTSAAIAEVNAGGSSLNYDGSTSTAVWAARRTAERTAITSNIFRSVFGDSRMMTEIRPVYQWQYNNLNDTAEFGLNFLNNFYNNGDGKQHVNYPHPVNYYLWGGGGAWYGGVSNPSGTGDVTLPQAAFTSPSVSGYQTDPVGSTWSFSGAAGIAANGSALGNPNATAGTQAAYLQPGGSFSENVYFSGGLADLYFNAAATGTQSFAVSIDGTNYSSSWTLAKTYSAQRSAVFDTGVSPGYHTVTFTATGGSGTAFISNVLAETVNGMYMDGIQNISTTIQNEADWATAFGLQMVSYEGGFNFGSGNVGTPLQIDANQDPRAEQASIEQLNEFYAAGGDLGMYYDTTNHIWALTLDINNQNTPKIQAVQSVLSQPQTALTNGTILPTTAGQSVTLANVLSAGDGAPGLYAFDATAPGTYTVTLSGRQSGSVYEQFMLDGQLLSGTTTLPASTGNSSPAITFTIATPGLHALFLQVVGSGTISPDYPAGSVTVTDASSTPPPPLAMITGTVFNDANGDGVQDNGETGVAGATVYVDLNNSGAFASGDPSAVTGANGAYTITGLSSGSYSLREIAPTGDAQTSPADNGAIAVSVLAGQTLAGQNFGLMVPPGPPADSISGVVFNDANHDGIQDDGETGVAGVTVYMDPSYSHKLIAGDQTAVTDANGNFVFTNPPADPEILRIVLPSGAQQTFPANGAGDYVGKNTGQTLTGENFGIYFPPAAVGSITGSVFNDLNGDHSQEAGELNLAGQTVFLDLKNDGKLDTGDPTAVTNSSGLFTFTGISTGAYTVDVLPAQGSRQTYPTSGGTKVTVTANTTVSAGKFGVTTTAYVGGYLFNDANANGVQNAGEAGLAGWTVYIDLNNDGKRESNEPAAVTTTTSTGYWYFRAVAPGTYTIRAVAPSGWTITHAYTVTLTGGQTIINGAIGARKS